VRHANDWAFDGGQAGGSLGAGGSEICNQLVVRQDRERLLKTIKIIG
jgi:hypothetical protein